MSSWVARQVVLELTKNKTPVSGANILILGFTFKEDCPDIRNTKVIDLVEHLSEYSMNVTVVDPLADLNEVRKIL